MIIQNIKDLSTLRIWCTQCDEDMIYAGIGLDHPEDGVFFTCPICNHRIWITLKEVK